MQMIGLSKHAVPQGMADLVIGLISTVFGELCATTGRRLLGLFGWRRHPYDIECIFTGFAFWIVVGVLAYITLYR